MLAPLARLTFLVVAALLISFVDEAFEPGATPAESGDTLMLPMSLDDLDDLGKLAGAGSRAFTIK